MQWLSLPTGKDKLLSGQLEKEGRHFKDKKERDVDRRCNSDMAD